MAEARDFKFGAQLGCAKAHHKTTPRGKVDMALGYFCNGRAVLLALAELLVHDRHDAELVPLTCATAFNVDIRETEECYSSHGRTVVTHHMRLISLRFH